MATPIKPTNSYAQQRETSAAIKAATNRIQGIEDDLAVIAGADTATLKQILARVLQTQKKILQFIIVRSE